MTTPHLLSTSPPAAADGSPVRRAPWSAARRVAAALVPLLPAVTALVAGLWHLGRPSVWRDEAATYTAADRSTGQLFRLTEHVDAVHALYYLLVHVDFAVFGAGVTALRMPSVLAGAAAAALVTATGRRLGSARAGFFAGMYWALLPSVDRYLQEGRSYALVSACVAAAAWFLASRRPVAAGAAMALGIGLNLFAGAALLCLALTWWVWRAAGPRADHPARRALVGAGLGVLAAGAVAVRAAGQSSAVEWIPRPRWTDVQQLAETAADRPGLAVLALAVAGYGALGSIGRPVWRLTALALPLAVLPAALLMGFSEVVTPFYVPRYVLYLLLGVAWLVGLGLDAALHHLALALRAAVRGLRAGTARLRRRDDAGAAGAAGALPGGASAEPSAAARRTRRAVLAAGAALGVLLGSGAVAASAWEGKPQQLAIRQPDGHEESLASLSSLVAAHGRPGDAVLFAPTEARRVWVVDPAAFHGTRDLMLARTAAAAGNLDGLDRPLTDLAPRLRGVNRVWLLSIVRNQPTRTSYIEILQAQGFRPIQRWDFKHHDVGVLFVRWSWYKAQQRTR